jgi:hypothetical protein
MVWFCRRWVALRAIVWGCVSMVRAWMKLSMHRSRAGQGQGRQQMEQKKSGKTPDAQQPPREWTRFLQVICN